MRRSWPLPVSPFRGVRFRGVSYRRQRLLRRESSPGTPRPSRKDPRARRLSCGRVPLRRYRRLHGLSHRQRRLQLSSWTTGPCAGRRYSLRCRRYARCPDRCCRKDGRDNSPFRRGTSARPPGPCRSRSVPCPGRGCPTRSTGLRPIRCAIPPSPLRSSPIWSRAVLRTAPCSPD